MDSIDRLKLAIYESGLSGEDQEALLEYVEEAVIDKDYLKTFGDVVPKYLTAVGGVSTIANSGKFNSIASICKNDASFDISPTFEMTLSCNFFLSLLNSTKSSLFNLISLAMSFLYLPNTSFRL